MTGPGAGSALLFARAQMEVSLGFHMIFAALGIGMPLLLLIVEGLYLRTRQPHYLQLARKWSRALALFFVIGAVSGTALSFELGLLWPRFMEFAGSVIGPAFALEGYAFFIEAIFIGLYLYGWDRLDPRTHFLACFPIALSGLLSGLLVVAVNAWMQVPGGFLMAGGQVVRADPAATFFSPVWLSLGAHSSLSCYIATSFAVAGIYALGILRGRRDAYHGSALRVSLTVGALAALLQLYSGHHNAQRTARYQPMKLAAMEAHYHTTRRAGALIGGVMDETTGAVRYGLRVPGLLSYLATGDWDGEVRGLQEVPADQRPNVLVTHTAYQIMVMCGVALAGLSLWFLVGRLRRPAARGEGRLLLAATVAAGPLGFLALEAGWIVTEAGRQPWIVYRVMRTSEAVTPSPHVGLSLVGFTILYVGLAVALGVLLRALSRRPRDGGDAAVPDA